MMRNKPLLIIIFIVVAIFVFVFLRDSGFSGISSNNGDIPLGQVEDNTKDDSKSTDSTKAVESVKTLAVEGLGVNSVNDIKVILVEAIDWPSSCLGIQIKDELCAQVVTPGYRIVVGADGVAEVTYHTDSEGNNIRRK